MRAEIADEMMEEGELLVALGHACADVSYHPNMFVCGSLMVLNRLGARIVRFRSFKNWASCLP